LQHHILLMTYGNRLYWAPLKDPKRVIDIGTGTGIWAIDFADAHPETEVIGVDLSPGQPTLYASRSLCEGRLLTMAGYHQISSSSSTTPRTFGSMISHLITFTLD
jgi:SAM-dependent methyltransferase